MCSARGRVNQISIYNQSWMALFPKQVRFALSLVFNNVGFVGGGHHPLLRFQKDTVQKVRFKYDHQ